MLLENFPDHAQSQEKYDVISIWNSFPLIGMAHLKGFLCKVQHQEKTVVDPFAEFVLGHINKLLWMAGPVAPAVDLFSCFAYQQFIPVCQIFAVVGNKPLIHESIANGSIALFQDFLPECDSIKELTI